jgi:hypothetical protein
MDDGETMSKMEIASSTVPDDDSSNKGKPTSKERGIYLLVPFVLCWGVYAIVQSEKKSHEQLNRYRSVPTEIAKSEVGGQVIELNTKQIKLLRNDLSHAVTTVALPGTKQTSRMRMLLNPASRLKHERLPVCAFSICQ